jgi:hypothetical protein
LTRDFFEVGGQNPSCIDLQVFINRRTKQEPDSFDELKV